VHKPILLEEWIVGRKETLKLTLHHHTKKELTKLHKPADNMVAVLIGPEGGLTENEVKISNNQGFNSLALGPRVLRTETAPIVILTALNVMWGDIV
jgi:16S rRNA (uracil1498-N3)-methyltransferase